jgi:hypothetical protein
VKALKWVLVAVVVMGVVGIAMAQDGADKPKDKPKVLRGTVVKVDGTNVTILTRASKDAEAKEVIVATDEKTKITIDGKEAKLEDLKKDIRVQVTPDTGTAVEIKARAPKQPKGGDAPKDAPK